MAQGYSISRFHEMLNVYLETSGIGIAPEEQDHIFKHYYVKPQVATETGIVSIA